MTKRNYYYIKYIGQENEELIIAEIMAMDDYCILLQNTDKQEDIYINRSLIASVRVFRGYDEDNKND